MQTPIHRSTLLVLVLLPLLSSCFFARFNTNEPLSRPDIARLQPGTTTAKQAVELLGAPTEVVQLGRRTAYRYHYTLAKNTGLLVTIFGLYNEDVRSDRLWLFFDEHQKLTHHGATFASGNVSYSLPWSSVRGDNERP